MNMASSTMLRMDALRVARAPWLLELRIFNYLPAAVPVLRLGYGADRDQLCAVAVCFLLSRCGYSGKGRRHSHSFIIEGFSGPVKAFSRERSGLQWFGNLLYWVAIKQKRGNMHMLKGKTVVLGGHGRHRGL